MSSYTALLRSPFDTISPDDEDFVGELLRVAALFRPFSEGLDEFLRAHGYEGDPADVRARVAFLRGAFQRAGMAPPRNMDKWFTEGRTVSRDTVFQLCFAFGLDGTETDAFFREVFRKERSFDCHRVEEAVWYFCLNNALTWQDAQELLRRLPSPPKTVPPGQEVVYTASIVTQLNRIDTREELIDYLSGNIAQFTHNNATACRNIRHLWQEAAGPNGLLIREHERFYTAGDDAATGRTSHLRLHEDGLRPWDAYLAILQLDRRQVSAFEPERTLQPVIRLLHHDAQDSFPDRQGIEAILAGKSVSYERVRKWLILLGFYTFWARKRLSTGSCEAADRDGERCVATLDQFMLDSGYQELYVGNPYDWIFLYASQDREPLITFREIWCSLAERVLETQTDQP